MSRDLDGPRIQRLTLQRITQLQLKLVYFSVLLNHNGTL
jgi:hypothetical protein